MSTECSPRTAAVVERFGDRDALLLAYNPGLQPRFCANPERCVAGSAPTLADANAAFGANTGAAWLVGQLTDISEFCGCRDKLTKEQLEGTARLVASAYPWLKFTELMLFFHRFKLGLYGRFYGAVDPMVITMALRDFMSDRAALIEAARQRREEQEWEEAKHRAVSYEQWRRMKAAAPGGQEAGADAEP